MKADHAEVDVELRLTVHVTEKGIEIRNLRSQSICLGLTRKWTRREMKDFGTDNPWADGGAAILNPSDATNGRALVRKAEAAGAQIEALLREAL